ncbi:MAG TPA: rod shape-determining protein MreC [Ignavibacteriaceae bacterium]|nr:rod shape-determining protein MreC [Ignavibacteriaceae bacterium]
MFRFISRLWENFKEYIILVILLIFSLFVLSQNQNSKVRQVRAVAFGSFAAVTSVVSDVINISRYKKDNERLREVNAELMLQVNRLREYGIVNHELKNLLGFRDTIKYPLIPATVVSKLSTKSQGSVTINVGEKDSVKAGMPVINDKGIVGVITSVSHDYSIARTLENIDLKLTVKDERSRIDGIMKWNGKDLVIVDVPKTYDIEPGDRIVTSEISSIVPVPVPVGVVTGLSKVETGIFNEAKIKPFVDFGSVENVFVVGIVESKQKNNLELNFFNRK